jgi:hypothetical protein
MKIKKTIVAFLVLPVILLGANNNANGQATGNAANDSIKAFEVKIVTSNDALAYFVLTVITGKKLTITISSGRVEEKDSILFTKNLEPSVALRQLSEINLNGLKKNYSNECLEDGLQMTVAMKRDGKKKSVHVSNYYQEDIGKIISLVNSIVPGKYRTWYDKEKLTADYKKCKGIK